MKNLKIGKKMMVGFGSIIVAIIVLATVVIITNSSTITNVSRIDEDSMLQTKTNDMIKTFYAARVNANIIYKVIDEEAASGFTKNVGDVESAFMDIFSYIDSHPVLEKFRSTLQEANESFKTWKNEVQTVITYNEQLDAARAEITTNGDTIGEMSKLLLNNQFDRIGIEAGGGGEDLPANIARHNERAKLADSIEGNATAFRLEIRNLIHSFDTSNVDETLAYMDEAIRLATQYRDSSTDASDTQNAQTVIDAVSAYRALTVDFAAISDAAADAVEKAVPLGDTTVLNMENTALALDTAMETQVSSTQGNATAAMTVVIIVVVISLVLAIVIALILTRAFTRPLKKMQALMEQAGVEGDLHFSDEVRDDILQEAQAKDEIGQSLKAFAQFVDHIRYISVCLEQIAEKDLSLEIEVLSSVDTMGNSLRSMLENLNTMFGEINAVASQVSTSSSEVARGAQSLAQGSTEQASTVEEISASISEITTQSKSASINAMEAARFSGEIKNIALDGNEKMLNMITSVQEINDASQAIGNVIKAIDDIAFQTNILALNAAVEAARAGEHGKGFAVVADEVRNLAAKSAEAAKETAALISANIEKAGAGKETANETAESLKKIVAGIEQTSASLNEISHQSEANEQATDQVRMAVDQVAQVVQQNSATSEESAAASQEMSGQAQQLQALIAQFKLKKSAYSSRF
ncbi:methyl-accepting chemotaxis protein [Christensenellaceae bacterium OttesenSCG-928-M15]|nr:methyl-accepting chemotaxis protein [Christensenellaceae bacterium OttesenSCG-928-M15]